jgi:hypothetical protein
MGDQVKRFYVILFATLCWMIVMRLFSPTNIVEFEFAGTVQKATEIIDVWGDKGVELARTSTYLDFIFLLLYSASISLGCKVASTYSKNQLLIKIGITLSWIVWLAGMSDVIENISMLNTLNEINQATISLAYYFAAIKFSMVAVGLLFIISSSLIGLAKRLKRNQTQRSG